MLSPSHLLYLITGDLIRRQSESSTLPAPCYDDCNSAYLEAQHTGKVPELCEPGSAFLSLYDVCATCISANLNSTDADSTSPEEEIPDFAQWVGYCEDAGYETGNGTSNGGADGINELLASWSSLSSSQSALQASLSSLGFEFSSTASTTSSDGNVNDDTSTTAPPQTSTAPETANETANQNGTEPSNSTDVGVIIPAVVVPVVVVFLIIAVVSWVVRRRRGKRRAAATLDDSYEGKAQLHGNSSRFELSADSIEYELDGDGSRHGNDIAELPVREIVGSEMDGGGHILAPDKRP
ncbi:hypothetical protein BDV12DRAFT_201098 [Aspergillus spectabilis]